jgi:hypothetical protein
VADAVVVVFVVAVELFVAAGFADFVATGFEVAPVLVAAEVGSDVGVADASAVVATGAISRPLPSADSFEDSCGGVIAMTAPKPPTVPPAINHARFISVLSPANL